MPFILMYVCIHSKLFDLPHNEMLVVIMLKIHNQIMIHFDLPWRWWIQS